MTHDRHHSDCCLTLLRRVALPSVGPLETKAMSPTVHGLVMTGHGTLSIPATRQHRDGFPRARQVLKEDLLAVWLRHVYSLSLSLLSPR